METKLIHPQGFAKPIKVTGGKDDHENLATIPFALYALLKKQSTVLYGWVRCDQCNGMHMYGLDVENQESKAIDGPSQRQFMEVRQQAPNVRFNRGT